MPLIMNCWLALASCELFWPPVLLNARLQAQRLAWKREEFSNKNLFTLMKRWKLFCGHECKARVKWNKNNAWRDAAERYDCRYCAIDSWCMKHSKCLVSLNSTSSQLNNIHWNWFKRHDGLYWRSVVHTCHDDCDVKTKRVGRGKIFSRIFRFRLQKRRNIVSDLSLHIRRRMRLLNFCGEKAPFMPTRGELQWIASATSLHKCPPTSH